MMERRQIVGLWRQGLGAAAAGGLLVTLVRAEGSSYRRPGARLLTGVGTAYAGTISGGCLEADVVRKGAWAVREGAVVERYSMAFDDTAEIPFGLGCGGTVDLLLEPVGAAEGVALMAAMERSLGGRESTVVSFLPGGGRGLRRLVMDEDGSVLFASKELSAEKIACAAKLTPGEEYEGRFVERMAAPQRLVILGAGDDAKPLARMAGLLGWTVIVGDGRVQLARAERFPGVDGVVVLDDAVPLEIKPEDAVVLMTHSYEQDRSLLARVLPLRPRYLGLLGARHRSSLLVTEAATMLGLPVETCCERLFAPIGLDLGGDGPDAIALAIVAEVQSVLHGKTSSEPRRLSATEVARQLELGGTSRYLNVQCALG